MYSNKYLELNLTVTASTFIFFRFVLPKIGHFLSSKILGYRKLGLNEHSEWNIRIVSTVHAIVVSILSFISLFVDNEGYNDPIWGQHWLTGTSLSINLGYAIVDASFLVFVENEEKFEFIIHHMLLLFATGWCAIMGPFWYIWAYRSFAELSTPLLNMRFFLLTLGKKKSNAFLYTNLFFGIIFFVCRIVPMPYGYILYYNYWNTEAMNRVGPYKYSFLIMIGMDILNIYWLMRIVRNFYRHFKAKQTGKKSD